MTANDIARHHRIPVDHAQAYLQGRERRNEGLTCPSTRAPSPFDAWLWAGFHDRDIERRVAP